MHGTDEQIQCIRFMLILGKQYSSTRDTENCAFPASSIAQAQTHTSRHVWEFFEMASLDLCSAQAVQLHKMAPGQYVPTQTCPPDSGGEPVRYQCSLYGKSSSWVPLQHDSWTLFPSTWSPMALQNSCELPKTFQRIPFLLKLARL